MTDYFALFGEPRRPWMDLDQLKAKFLALTAEAHPDKVHAAAPADRALANRRFAELNSAFNCLREPKERLRHLLELELGTLPKEVHEIPSNLADLFTEIARLQREVNGFLAEANRVQSPLLRVQMFERGQEWMDRLRAVQTRLGERHAGLVQELQALDAEWVRSDSDPVQLGALLQRVEQIHQRLSFYTRWNAQIQESLVQLSL
jgi:DnaJ-domain-containing protein 1